MEPLLATPTVIPEPLTLACGMLSVAAVGRYARRRLKS